MTVWHDLRTCASPPPPRGAGELHVWIVDLDRNPGEAGWLAADEIERRDRFRFANHAARFTAARSALRCILSRYLGQPAPELRFRQSRWGKPELECKELEFNLSHSESLAAIAVSVTTPVGVDIEKLRSDLSAVEIAGLVFTPEEQMDVENCAGAQRDERFFRYWTRTEALMKAQGTGFLAPLSVEV